MFDAELLRKTLKEMEEAQMKRFRDSGKSFAEFFTSINELNQDSSISMVRHMLMFAEMQTK